MRSTGSLLMLSLLTALALPTSSWARGPSAVIEDLATLRFPDEDPLTALQNLLTKHLFGLPLKKLAGSNDTAIGVERTAMLVRSDLQAPPKLLDDISDQIIEAHQEAAAASEKRNPSRVSKGAPNEGTEGR